MCLIYIIWCNKLSPDLEAASVDTGDRLFAGSSGEISSRWQAERGVTGSQGGDGSRNRSRSQIIADFFHKNKWVRIVYSTFHIFVPRPLPHFQGPGDKAILFKCRIEFRVY